MEAPQECMAVNMPVFVGLRCDQRPSRRTSEMTSHSDVSFKYPDSRSLNPYGKPFNGSTARYNGRGPDMSDDRRSLYRRSHSVGRSYHLNNRSQYLP